MKFSSFIESNIEKATIRSFRASQTEWKISIIKKVFRFSITMFSDLEIFRALRRKKIVAH